MPNRSRRIKDVTRVGPEGAPDGALALDPRLPARETVAGLEVGRETVAYPFSQLRIARVVNDRVGGLPIVIVHQPSSDTTTAYEARAKGKVLTFQAANDDASSVIDRETRSTWNAYGLCLEGPLKGTQLKQVILVPAVLVRLVAVPPGDQGLHRTLKGEIMTMQNRRTFLGIAAAALLPIRHRCTSTRATSPRRTGETRVDRSSRRVRGGARRTEHPARPARSGPGHRHPGPVLGYIVEGQMRFAINHEPEQVLPAGGTFFEPSGAVHTTDRVCEA